MDRLSAGLQEISSVQASNLPGLRFPSAIPNVLPGQVYKYIDRACVMSETLSEQKLSSLRLQIPDVNDDNFMQIFSK